MNAGFDISKFRHRAVDLEAELANPAVYADQRRVGDLARELQRLKKLMADHDRLQVVQTQLVTTEQLANGPDPEFAELAKSELATLRQEATQLAHEVQLGILPPDPNDSRNTIVEIRAGTGGEEAALFAADLFRMYSRFADKLGWKIEVMDTSYS